MVVLLTLLINKLTTPRIMSADELRLNGAIVFDTPRRFDDFTLLNHKGEPFTRDDFVGQWSLVFFGFTHCPDICPTTMAELDRLVGKLPDDIAQQTQVVLVSLDPARDTPEVLSEYVGYFDPEFIGVTGDFLTLRRFANQVNVAFNKVTIGDDYTVDHSGNIVLINPRGDYHGFFKPPFELAKLKATYSSIQQSFAH
ncbi:SCO family protein [uncultured Gilvimarinus sp.]|uniref:SCO family protein n=1 Tax=uncultured Gilvimarinus sp. TaxID=1689143 RepID=UPI0030EDDF6D